MWKGRGDRECRRGVEGMGGKEMLGKVEGREEKSWGGYAAQGRAREGECGRMR